MINIIGNIFKMKVAITKVLKIALKIISLLLVLCAIMVLYANWRIPSFFKKYIYQSVNDVPIGSVALVLGTSKYIGKSGNRYRNYNEPRDMHNTLVEAGVPESLIYQDYAGFRTLDSVVRMVKVFGQHRFIVISQRFHNERAIFLARHYGYEAYGFNATDLAINGVSIKTKVRELLAKVKVYVDIVFGIEPRFLGESIEVNTAVG